MAITVAGFSGIVAVLGVRSVEHLSAVAKARLANLLVTALAAAFFSFLPVVLQLFDMGASAIWSASGVSLIGFSIIFLLLRTVSIRRLGLGTPGGPRVWVALIFLVAFIFVVSAQVVNIAGFFGVPSGAPYAAGVLALLVLAGLQFALLVLEPVGMRPDPPAA